MKCGIITFHRAINYGGVLQALALQHAIKAQNVDVEIIDYYAPAIENLYRPSVLKRLSLQNIKRIISILLYNGTIFFNNEGFAAFRSQYLNTSAQKYYDGAQLKQSQYDLYIAGSDQIWSPVCAGFDKNYFLSFVEESKKKTSYAASFGVGEIPDALTCEYFDLLNDFQSISVREADGAAIIKNVLGKDVPIVLDPTLLLTKEQWSAYAEDTPCAPEKYILLYMISEDQELVNKAIEFSKKTGLKVYYINDRLYRTKGVTNLRKVSPNKWLRLFMDAEFVFTNSFHGVSFSINFQKKFLIHRLKANVKANSRINNILDLLSLEHRSDFDLIEQDIDYPSVTTRLENEREKSFAYLNSILSGDTQ